MLWDYLVVCMHPGEQGCTQESRGERAMVKPCFVRDGVELMFINKLKNIEMYINHSIGL